MLISLFGESTGELRDLNERAWSGEGGMNISIHAGHPELRH